MTDFFLLFYFNLKINTKTLVFVGSSMTPMLVALGNTHSPYRQGVVRLAAFTLSHQKTKITLILQLVFCFCSAQTAMVPPEESKE